MQTLYFLLKKITNCPNQIMASFELNFEPELIFLNPKIWLMSTEFTSSSRGVGRIQSFSHNVEAG